MRGSSCEAGKDLEYSQASHWAASLGDTVPLFSLSVRNMELLKENFRKNLFYLHHAWGSRASDHFDTLIGINNIIKFIYSIDSVLLFLCQEQVSKWIMNIDI